MFRKRFSRALAVVTVASLVMAATVLADNLQDTLVAGGSGASATIGEGDVFSQDINFQVQQTGGNNTTFPATVNFSKGTAPSWISLSASSHSFTGYGDVFTLTVSGTAPALSGGQPTRSL